MPSRASGGGGSRAGRGGRAEDYGSDQEREHLPSGSGGLIHTAGVEIKTGKGNGVAVEPGLRLFLQRLLLMGSMVTKDFLVMAWWFCFLLFAFTYFYALSYVFAIMDFYGLRSLLCCDALKPTASSQTFFTIANLLQPIYPPTIPLIGHLRMYERVLF